MASSDNEDYYYTDDEDDYDCTEDDGGGFGCSDVECPEEIDSDDDCVDCSPGPDKEKATKGYVLEMEDDVRKRQEIATAEISELLFVPPGYAAALLRHCQWDTEHFKNEWFSDNRRICDAVGLPVDGGVPTVVLNDRDLTCAICFESYGPGDMRSVGCSHYYCHECWRGYIRAAVGDGPRCLSLRCPDPSCSAAVVRELVDDVADEEDKERYTMFEVRSYVEEGKNTNIRWCPGPGCTLAVRSLIGRNLYEVLCACKHGFCFRCGEEAHRPASCETTREWMAKNVSDGETVNWVLANTKHCPKCRRAIEKNQGCMHMTCSAPCLHQFCWLCLGPWKDHGGNFYHCNRYAKEKAEGKLGECDNRQRQAKASLERYLHYYERWTAYGDSGRKARADLDGLEAGGLDEFAEAVGVPTSLMDFVKEAYAQIIECRRVLRWTYAYMYYLDSERDGVKRKFIEYIQGEAESALEKLHGCVERERQELVWECSRNKEQPVWEAAAPESSDACVEELYKSYREKVVHLSVVMRKHFNNLVKGFEAGLAEVVA